MFIIFVTLPKIVFAIQIIDFSSTHTKRIVTLDNGKTLVIYVPKNKSYKNILVHFHGFGDNNLNTPSVDAMETAIKEHNYSNTVVFFPVDGICRNVESASVINNTVNLVYKKYNEFLSDNNISNYNLSVSQVSGTSDAANTFINLISNKKISLFLFDSYLPNYYYSNDALNKVNNLIMLSELSGGDYLGSAKDIGKRFKEINKNGLLVHYADSVQNHALADDKGLSLLYPDFIKNGKLGDNYSSESLKLLDSSGTGNLDAGTTPGTSNPSSGTTSGSSSGQTSTPTTPSEEDNTVQSGGKDTGTIPVEENSPRLEYDSICRTEGFMTASKIVGIIILVAKWLAPLILIIMGMIDFFKAVISSSDKALSDATGTFIKRMIIAIIIPIIPGLLHYLIGFLVGIYSEETEEKFELCTNCVNNPLDKKACDIELYDYDNQRGEKDNGE